MKNIMSNTPKFPQWTKWLPIAIPVFIVLFSAIYTVQAGSRKVVMRFGEAIGVSGEGVHLKIPFIDSTRTVDIKTQKVATPTTAASADLQNVQTEVSLNYRLDKDKLIPIIRNTGLDVDEKIIAPRIHETVKSVTAKFTAEKLLTERPIVKANIDRSMRESLSKYHIIVEDVQLTDFRFSREFDAAIEAKQTEVQRTLKAKNILERTKIEAEQRITQAEGEAEAIRIQAEAIRAQGGREYVNLKAIEKWDGRLPTYAGGDAVPMINIENIK
jgi:regulator of protease activity HflC (stomatin/prohibitin superfamily)